MRTGLEVSARDPLAGRADLLLDSYEQERRSVARSVSLTQALFWLEAGMGPAASAVRSGSIGRTWSAPNPAEPSTARRARGADPVSAGLRLSGQPTVIGKPAGTGAAGGSHRGSGGVPATAFGTLTCVVDGRWRRLHEVTASPGFHVLLHRDAVLPSGVLPLADCPAAVHRVQTWRDAVVVVRPDGHIGYRGPASQIGSWFGLVHDRPAAGPGLTLDSGPVVAVVRAGPTSRSRSRPTLPRG